MPSIPARCRRLGAFRGRVRRRSSLLVGVALLLHASGGVRRCAANGSGCAQARAAQIVLQGVPPLGAWPQHATARLRRHCRPNWAPPRPPFRRTARPSPLTWPRRLAPAAHDLLAPRGTSRGALFSGQVHGSAQGSQDLLRNTIIYHHGADHVGLALTDNPRRQTPSRGWQGDAVLLESPHLSATDSGKVCSDPQKLDTKRPIFRG